MAQRVTADEVLAIMKTSLTSAQMDPFITAANLTVDRVLGSSGLDDDLLKEIERWLSAHFACVLSPLASKQVIGDGEITYQGEQKMLLLSTTYGQTVATLDPTGKLASTGKVRASFACIKSERAI